MSNNEAVLKTAATLLAAAAAAHGSSYDPASSYTYRVLNNPTGGDAFMFRNAEQQNAQQLADRIFGVLAGVLGGQAPRLNFLPTGNPLVANDLSADPVMNAVNIDPLATASLIDARIPYHSAALIDIPHEMAHLRQTAQVIADTVQREGGAQAFADYVTPNVAQRTGIPYTPGNYDGSYATYVQQVQPLGTGWLLGGQFGHQPVQFP